MGEVDAAISILLNPWFSYRAAATDAAWLTGRTSFGTGS